MYIPDEQCSECNRTPRNRLISWIERKKHKRKLQRRNACSECRKSRVPLVSWIQRRREKKRMKRKSEIFQVSQEAAQLTQVWQTEKLDKLRAIYQGKLARMQERLDALAAENQDLKLCNNKLHKMNTFYREKQAYLKETVDTYIEEKEQLKDTVCCLNRKVSNLEVALCNATQSAAHKSAKCHRDDVNSGSSRGFTSSTKSTSELESLQTKILSLEFTIFRQRKLLELMEDTIKVFEPSFSMKTFKESKC